MSENDAVHPTYTYEFIKGDFDKAVLTGDAHSDNLMTALLGLGAEFWTMRRRMNLMEKMLSEKHVLDLAAFDAYEPNDQEKAAWQAQRDDFIRRVFSVFVRETGPTDGPIPRAVRAPPINN